MKRETALQVLSLHRDNLPELATVMWDMPGVVAVLLQEVVMLYPKLDFIESVNPKQMNRVCNAMALMQRLAMNRSTCNGFMNAHLLLYIFPFLQLKEGLRTCEYMRTSALGVIAGLVRTEAPGIINFLLRTEFLPLCLHNIKQGNEMSQTLSTFLLHKILDHKNGLRFVMQIPKRASTILDVLSTMVDELAKSLSVRLLKNVLRCYIRFLDSTLTLNVLSSNLPKALEDGTFSAPAQSDPHLRKLFEKLFVGISQNVHQMHMPDARKKK